MADVTRNYEVGEKVLTLGGNHVIVDDGSPIAINQVAPAGTIYFDKLTGAQWWKASANAGDWIEAPILKLNTVLSVTKESTGFTNNDSIDVSFNSTTKKITLTGTFEAYWQGVKVAALVSGWQSEAIPGTTNTPWFLYYNGSAFVWSQSAWTFDMLQIAYVYYTAAGVFQFAQRECHGFMPHDCHETDHQNLGTYLKSGGDLSAYTLGSTTAAQRRPDTSSTTISDEDLKTVLPGKTDKLYHVVSLTGAGVSAFAVDQADFVLLNGNHPYYNQYNGSAWVQTPLANNSYMCMWKVAIPVTSDAASQKFRYLWVQGQSSGTLTSQQALTPQSLNLGGLTGMTPEFVFISRVIIQYTAANWVLTQVDKLFGNKVTMVATVGSFLSTVNTDASLTGSGTVLDPLVVNSSPYVLLAGRAGGQTLHGGTLTTQSLTLQGNAADLTTGQVDVASSKEASSATIAALTVAGGLGVSKKIIATGSITGGAGSWLKGAGSFSTCNGYGATAAGAYSVVTGYGASAPGSGAAAYGGTASAVGTNSVALGYGAFALREREVMLGTPGGDGPVVLNGRPTTGALFIHSAVTAAVGGTLNVGDGQAELDVRDITSTLDWSTGVDAPVVVDQLKGYTFSTYDSAQAKTLNLVLTGNTAAASRAPITFYFAPTYIGFIDADSGGSLTPGPTAALTVVGDTVLRSSMFVGDVPDPATTSFQPKGVHAESGSEGAFFSSTAYARLTANVYWGSSWKGMTTSSNHAVIAGVDAVNGQFAVLISASHTTKDATATDLAQKFKVGIADSYVLTNFGIGTSAMTNNRVHVVGGSVSINPLGITEHHAIGGLSVLHGGSSYPERALQITPAEASKNSMVLQASTTAGNAQQWWSYGVTTSNLFKICSDAGLSGDRIRLSSTETTVADALLVRRVHTVTFTNADLVFRPLDNYLFPLPGVSRYNKGYGLTSLKLNGTALTLGVDWFEWDRPATARRDASTAYWSNAIKITQPVGGTYELTWVELEVLDHVKGIREAHVDTDGYHEWVGKVRMNQTTNYPNGVVWEALPAGVKIEVWRKTPHKQSNVAEQNHDNRLTRKHGVRWMLYTTLPAGETGWAIDFFRRLDGGTRRGLPTTNYRFAYLRADGARSLLSPETAVSYGCRLWGPSDSFGAGRVRVK